MSCGDLGYVENADRSRLVFSFPHSVTFTCHDGYKMNGIGTIFCSKDGMWLPKKKPTCEPIKCPPLEKPLNGDVNYTNTTYFSEAKYVCDKGYQLIGDKSRICKGTWTGEAPVCKVFTCGIPQFEILAEKKETYNYLTVIPIKCKDGESKTAICKMDGWVLGCNPLIINNPKPIGPAVDQSKNSPHDPKPMGPAVDQSKNSPQDPKPMGPAVDQSKNYLPNSSRSNIWEILTNFIHVNFILLIFTLIFILLFFTI
jgi:hypothetical protein